MLDEGLNHKLSYCVKRKRKNLSEEKGKMKLPSFDGRAENYDKWGINWAAFAEVEGLSDALGDCLDPNMLDSSVSV